MAKRQPAILWSRSDPGLAARLAQAMAKEATGPLTIFFRADDAAVPGHNFQRLIDLFARHAMPIDLAVVPAWLPMRAAEFRKSVSHGRSPVGLHMHGLRHMNHERSGKKQEFGPGRRAAAKRADLARGLGLLERHLGRAPDPIFTPPWNRADTETLEMLRELGFRAVSRFAGSKNPTPATLAGLDVNLDLHTLRADTFERAESALLEQARAAASGGRVGVMLHHFFMNRNAFDFLGLFLATIRDSGSFLPTTMAGLLNRT